ncbi:MULTISPECIES: hypothetical protein [unclassified Brevundimonas]|uniref:hypothetical protein n=1 Tax=unclassified Brevundimonas TaxID=2622653 RepID=UPI0025C57344|nr:MULTISPECIES: hypothetical protein [unclassified Brevundimonas]
MIRKLVNRMVAGAVAASAAFVAIVALGATLFYALSMMLLPLGAAAITAGVFALIAIAAYLVFANKANPDDDADDEDDEPETLPGRILHMVQQRPVVGVVAALAAGAVLLKKPGLAAMALAAFNDQGRDKRDSRSRSKSRRRRR